MIKKLLAAAAAVVASAAIALGANIALLTGPQPAADLVSIINGLINTINGSVGRISANTSTVSNTSTTAEVTLQQFTVNPGYLAAAGDGLRVTCWGTFAGGAATKTVKLYFGSSAVTASAATVSAGGWYLQQTVMRKSATTQAYAGWGEANATIAPAVGADAAETLANSVLVKCTGTSSVSEAGSINSTGMIVEGLK
jgi:hypothetical protein